MKKIGILLRENNNELKVSNEIIDYLSNYDISIIGIILYEDIDFNKVIDSVKLCDGIILPGGEKERDIDLKLVRYLYENNIPTFGICLGMQNMAKALGGTLEKFETNFHNSNLSYVHKVNIKKDSLIYKILCSNSILVNSRHNYYVDNTNLNVSAYSEDYVIEAIEDKNKKFFLGIQWHPESIRNDINSKLLIDEFINSI